MFLDLSTLYCSVASDDLFIVTGDDFEVDLVVKTPLMTLKMVFLPCIALDFVAVVEGCP